MNNKITFLAFLLLSSLSFAQVNVGKGRSWGNLWVSSHKTGKFEEIKKNESIFVMPSKFDPNELEEIIEEIWTVNKISFITQDEFDENKKSYLSSGKIIIQPIDRVYSKKKKGGPMQYHGFTTVGAFIFIKFNISTFSDVKTTKRGKLKYDVHNIAEIFFTPNIRYRSDIAVSAGGKMRIGNFKKINEKYGETAGFYNYDLGYIKNYFQELNNRLKNSQNLKIEDGILKKEKLKKLKSNTLYAPEWILKKYNAMAATYGKTRTKEELFEKYTHKYEVLSNDEIDTKIINGDDFYYLMHTQFNQKKIISIIHSTTGEIIYLEEDGSYNIKSSDLKKISKYIK